MSLKAVAKETLRVLEEGAYTAPSGLPRSIREALDGAVAETIVYSPDEGRSLLSRAGRGGGPPRVEVTGETTQVGAQRLTADGSRVLLLNFASARNPGGGFINGAKAQEEDLARCSGLHPCLLRADAYYRANRQQASMLYTDHVIYSPGVPFFRTRSRNWIEHPFVADVITAPAPNAGQARMRGVAEEDIVSTLRRRAGVVLAVAQEQGARKLVLGAWGCGVFRNDPATCAAAFGDHLEGPRFAGAFDEVLFAVLDRNDNGTLRAFQARFA